MAQEQSSPHEDPNRVVHGNDVQPSCVWVKQQEGAQTDELTTKFLKNGKIDDYDINGVPYEHVDILGRGNSGLVEKVQHKSTKQIYARKLLVIPRKRQAEQESIFLNEVAVIRRLCDHHHFIKVMAAYKTEKNFGIILFPVAENGDLSEFLEHYRGLQEDLQRLEVADPKLKTAEMELKTMTVVLERAFGCLASGLAFMHEQRIRHKDIKPQNVLVHAGTVLFTDFGYSLDSSRFSHSATDGRPDFLTRRYCAKEVLEHERRDSSSDVWSLGCVLIEVLCALTCAIEIDEARIFSEAMPDIHADLVSTSISDEYLPLVDNLVDMTSLEASMRPTSKVVRESLLIHHTFNCQECLAGASGTRTIDTEYLSNGVKNPSSTDDARKPGAFDYEIPKSASASDSLLAEGDETRLGVNQDALNMLNQVPRDPSIIGGQLVLMQTMPTDSSYELRSSTDAASQPQGLGLQQENSRNISIRRTMANDGTRTILNDDGSDTSDRDPDTCTDHLSDIALPIPRSTELETGTEAGTWDEISERTKTLGGYDQGANKHLHSSIRSSLEKSLHKDTNDSYDGATREDPIAEHSKSPQQPSIAGRATNPQPIEWSEAYQRYFQRKYNHTTRMYCM
jgi:serine/threonine protein kinase